MCKHVSLCAIAPHRPRTFERCNSAIVRGREIVYSWLLNCGRCVTQINGHRSEEGHTATFN